MMKRIIKIFSSIICAAIVMSSGMFVTSPVVRADAVEINKKNFPDDVFREFVTNCYDTDRDGILDSGAMTNTQAIYISTQYAAIEDLTGIEYFSGLTYLDCSGCQIKELDLSKNTQLTTLYCDSNPLTSLDVSGCSQLKKLHCVECEITNLDISGCTRLDLLVCFGNKIASLDVRNCTELEQLICFENKLTSLDVSQNTKLESLMFYSNKVQSIDISKNTNLKKLICYDNQLKSLDVTNNTELEWLVFDKNQIKEIDVSNNTKLTMLCCSSNLLTSIDVSNSKDLSSLLCYNNYISSVDISNNGYIKSLFDVTTMKTEGKNKVEEFSNACAWLEVRTTIDNEELVIDHHTSLIYEGETIHEATTTVPPTPTAEPTPTAAPSVTATPGSSVAPTSTTVPTAAPTSSVAPTSAPSVAPTVAPSKSIGDFVSRCYDVALGRPADSAGYQYWVDLLTGGAACGAQVGYGFIFSTEYFNKNRTNKEFVTDLYSMYFDREPDSAGFDYWVEMLDSGASREDVFAGFANSLEFYNLCSDYGVVQGIYLVGVPNDQQGGVNCFVARMYKVCLNRLPDMGGQSGWVLKLMNGEVTGTSCAYGFVFSPEFIGKGLTNEQFVTYMYAAFFGREADEAGFNAWVSRLNEGASYEDVFAGFSGSAEFYNLCGSYGINA